MSILRAGATKKYSEGWERVFGGSPGRSAAKTQKTAAASPPAKKKAPAATGAKKAPTKKAKK